MTNDKTTSKVTAKQIREYLRKTWANDASFFVEEVPNAAGFKVTNYADAIAVGLWNSRGLNIHGFEIKVSRSDWLKELKTPTKADAFIRYCDFWYIVASEGVVELAELPENWGLIIANGKGLRTEKKAPRLNAEMPSRTFLAALINAGD